MPKKIRVGLVGASVKGTWSALSHLPALAVSEDFELTAVCTTRPETAEAARQAYGARLAFSDVNALVASPEIDAVAVVVRVPSHYVPTKAALEAGKHVYCEWPLGRTTAEAEELTALAQKQGVVTAVGLQARLHPAIMLMKQEVEAGAIGKVMAVNLGMIRGGVMTRTADRTWQRDAELGAHTLTIAAGHCIDAMNFVAGDLTSLSAVVSTQARQWLDIDNDKVLDVTAPDNVLVSGRLANGAVASVHAAAVPYAGAGYRMEVFGSEGTLVATSEELPQMGEVHVSIARGNAPLAPLPIPDSLRFTTPGTPAGRPYSVGQLYVRFAEAIRGGGEVHHPTFADALTLHRLIDAIDRSSREGREVKVG